MASVNNNILIPGFAGVNPDDECCEDGNENSTHCYVCRPPLIVYSKPKVVTQLGIPLALAAFTGLTLKRFLFPAKNARVLEGRVLRPVSEGVEARVEARELKGSKEMGDSNGNEAVLRSTLNGEGQEPDHNEQMQEEDRDEEVPDLESNRRGPESQEDVDVDVDEDVGGFNEPKEEQEPDTHSNEPESQGEVEMHEVADSIGSGGDYEDDRDTGGDGDVPDARQEAGAVGSKVGEESGSPRSASAVAASAPASSEASVPVSSEATMPVSSERSVPVSSEPSVPVNSEAAPTDGSPTTPASPATSRSAQGTPSFSLLLSDRLNRSPLSSAPRTPRVASRPYGLAPHDKVGGARQRVPVNFPVPAPQAEEPAPGDVDFSDLLLELEESGELVSTDWMGAGDEGGVYPALLARSASGKEASVATANAGAAPCRSWSARHERAASHHSLDMDMTDVLEAMEEDGGGVLGLGEAKGTDAGSDHEDVEQYRTGGVAIRDVLRGVGEAGEDEEDDSNSVERAGEQPVLGSVPAQEKEGAEDVEPVSPLLGPSVHLFPTEDPPHEGAPQPAADAIGRDLHVHFPPNMQWPGGSQGGAQGALNASIIDTELAMAQRVRRLPASGEELSSSARASLAEGSGDVASPHRPPIRRLSSIVFAGIGPEQQPQPGIPSVGSSALLSVADKIQARAIQIGKLVASLKDAPHTQLIGAISQLETELHVARSMLEFGAAVAQETPVRDAGIAGFQRVVGTTARFNVWQDVYAAVSACVSDKKRCASPTPVETRYIDYLLRGYHRRGMSLPPDQQQQMRDLRTRIRHLGVHFQENVANATDQRTCLFSREDLEGLNERVMQALVVQEDGCFLVPARVDFYLPIMQECVRASTRLAMELCFSGRAVVENGELLRELLALRHQGAQLLGYKSHAHYVLQNCYLDDPSKVYDFLVQLEAKLQPLARKELELMREKKRACEGSADVTVADLHFYLHRLEEEMLGSHEDLGAVVDYFPLRIVVVRALDLIQVSLGLVMQEEVQTNVWDDTVQLFSVWDARFPDRPTLVGHVYLDLYHREGKESGVMSIFHLQPGCQAPFFLSEHGKQPPVSTLVADFAVDDATGPTLMSHAQVLQLMGKLGIMMHQICSKVDHARFAGGMVESDMQDLTGLVYEKYCWSEEVLLHLSAHKDTGAPLPDHLLAPLLKRHELQQRHFVLLTMRQLLLARLDLELHTAPVDDPRRLLNDLHRQILGLEPPLGTNILASFEHIVAGYDTLYFSYLWKEVIATDLFASRFQADPFSPEVGLDFRLKVLELGGSVKASDLITSFLGRPPNLDAYLATKGL